MGRDFSFKSRNENSKLKTDIQIFDIEEIEHHFHENIRVINSQFDVANQLIEMSKVEEAKNIWRSQVVFLESAFDFFNHEIIKLGILSIYHGDWEEKTDRYLSLRFAMRHLEVAKQDVDDDEWLKQWIIDNYSMQTCMDSKSLRQVCDLIGIGFQNIADEIYYKQGSKVKTIDQLRKFLDDLFQRRNLIAHQMDRKSEDAKNQDIEENTVREYISGIETIVETIVRLIKLK